GKFFAIDARETAPAKATRDMYLQDGKPQPEWSQSGPLAAATPGALAGYALAVKDHGRLKLADLAGPAGGIGERGGVVERGDGGALASAAKTLVKNCGPEVSLLKSDGSAYREGETLKQPDLAKVLRGIAEKGADYFYRGPFAAAVGKWMAEHGGRLTADDFANYQPVLRDPLITTYRGRTIVGFPPPSSGGVHVAEMLNILENFDLASTFNRDPGAYQ